MTVGKYLARSYTEAFLVLHQGHILTEQYWSGMTPQTPHRLYSVGKSLLANVVAILADEGRLSLEAGITDYVHELAETAYAGATLRQLLDMQSGVKYEYDLQGAAKSMTEHGRHYRAAGMFPKLPGEDPQSGQYDFLVSLKTAARDHGQIFFYKCCRHGCPDVGLRASDRLPLCRPAESIMSGPSWVPSTTLRSSATYKERRRRGAACPPRFAIWHGGVRCTWREARFAAGEFCPSRSFPMSANTPIRGRSPRTPACWPSS